MLMVVGEESVGKSWQFRVLTRKLQRGFSASFVFIYLPLFCAFFRPQSNCLTISLCSLSLCLTICLSVRLSVCLVSSLSNEMNFILKQFYRANYWNSLPCRALMRMFCDLKWKCKCKRQMANGDWSRPCNQHPLATRGGLHLPLRIYGKSINVRF